ncbi:MAG: hypothetical protein JEZ09_17460 [Salinivirgaceae bacterium]|nr:hypothetical protein [Salinivirgaceae bacterium]
MKKIILTLSFLSTMLFSNGQNRPEISDMKWGADFNIHITFSNDSSTIHEVKGLYHSKNSSLTSDEVTYYPVNLDADFINELKNKDFDKRKKDNTNPTKEKSQTLWSALHNNIGGGYIHFINSIIYSFESGVLSMTAPLMKRPESDWKPNPMTESFKRTKKWEYYAPNNIKLAQKEYKLKEKKGELGDIKLLPPAFIDLFRTTSDKEYQVLVSNRETNKVAIIDMIKLMVGSHYLGQEQIDYIQNAVTKSIVKYNANNLPSVIIFDDFEAAVAMTLNLEGYKIDRVVFNNESQLTSDQIDSRLQKMEAIIEGINQANKKVFEKNLKQYYN